METEDLNQETAVAEQLSLGTPVNDAALKAAIEAIVYVCEEPATAAQIANALQKPQERVEALLGELAAEYAAPGRGLMIREVAGGYKMATKAEHHEAVRTFAKSLKPALRLSLAALETLATIAYKQPITAPEIMEIRGVQGAGVLKTLLDRKLIQTAGRKNVVGRPILYKTAKEFLLQFGLKDLTELPTLKEFEELRRLAIGDEPEAEQQTISGPVAGAVEAEPEATSAPVEPEEAPEDLAALSPEAEGAIQEPEAAAPEAAAEPAEPGEAPVELAMASPEAEGAIQEPEAAIPESAAEPEESGEAPPESESVAASPEPEAASPEPAAENGEPAAPFEAEHENG